MNNMELVQVKRNGLARMERCHSHYRTFKCISRGVSNHWSAAQFDIYLVDNDTPLTNKQVGEYIAQAINILRSAILSEAVTIARKELEDAAKMAEAEALAVLRMCQHEGDKDA